MAYVIINEKHLIAIADALRKLSGRPSYKPRDMAAAIEALGENISTGLVGKYIVGVDVPGTAFEALVKDCIDENGAYFVPDGMWTGKTIKGVITIPWGLKELPANTFKDTLGITDVIFANDFTTIGDYAFYNALDMADKVFVVGVDVETIGNYAFANNTSLSEIELNDKLTSIGNYAFSNTSLNKININDNLTSIGEYAFQNTNFTELPNVPSISKGMFDGCSYLVNANFPNNIESIGEYAFNDCQALTTVTCNEGLESIGAYAFNNCQALNTVTFNEGLKSIGDYAFYACGYEAGTLKNLVFPSTLETIGNYAFYHDYDQWSPNPSRQHLVFNEGLKSIGYYAFYMREVTFDKLPSTLETIGSNAFYGIRNTEITIPPSVKTIASRAFWNHNGTIKKITLNEGIERIGVDAFFGNQVTEISFPKSLKDLECNAIRNTSHLKKIEFNLSNDHKLYVGSTVTSGNAFRMASPTASNKNYITFKGQDNPASRVDFYRQDAFSDPNINNVNTVISVPWDESENPAGFPWGATSATIIYNNGL